MKLNGWSRIWVVIIVLFAIAVIFISYDNRPKQSSIEWLWINEASDIFAEILTKKEGKTIFSYQIKDSTFKDKTNQESVELLIKVAESPSEGQRIFSNEISELNEKYQHQLFNLSNKLRNHYLISFAWWLIPSLALYLSGWTIGWVIRGFKDKKH